MIAPISHPYPPPGYGPWERVTHDLTEQLVARGHDVTLYAAADSKTHARLFPTVDRSLETLPAEQRQDVEDRHIAAALDHARKQDFDVIHSHLHIHVLRHVGQDPLPVLTTLHGSAWNTDHHQVLRRRHGLHQLNGRSHGLAGRLVFRQPLFEFGQFNPVQLAADILQRQPVNVACIVPAVVMHLAPDVAWLSEL